MGSWGLAFPVVESCGEPLLDFIYIACGIECLGFGGMCFFALRIGLEKGDLMNGMIEAERA